MSPDGRQLISVRTDVVFSVMVESLVEESRGKAETKLGDTAESALRLAPGALGARHGPPLPSDAADALIALARMGWLIREDELARFARAQAAPAADLHALLTASDWAATASACADLALAEPVTRPEPGDAQAISWQVAGPGGHVRHYVALRCIGSLPGMAIAERAAAVSDPAELKRVWLFGFLLAEAARLRDASSA